MDKDLNRSFSKVRGELHGLGLRTSRTQKTSSLLAGVIGDWAPQNCMTSVDRVGWIDRTSTGFVLGSGRVIGAGEVLPMGAALSPLSENLRPSRRCRNLARDCRKGVCWQSDVGPWRIAGILRTAPRFSGSRHGWWSAFPGCVLLREVHHTEGCRLGMGWASSGRVLAGHGKCLGTCG